MTTPNDHPHEHDDLFAPPPDDDPPLTAADERATQLIPPVADDESDVNTTAPTQVGDIVYTPPSDADDLLDDENALSTTVPTLIGDLVYMPPDRDTPPDHDARSDADVPEAFVDDANAPWRDRDPEQSLETIYAFDETRRTADPDLALTSLDAAALSDLVASEEAALDAERKAKPLPVYRTRYPMPPMHKLPRGHLGSILPAILLMLIGAWLTLTGTGGLSGILPADSLPPELASVLLTPSPLIIAGVIVGALVISVLGYALGTGRWTRGLVFAALCIVGVAVVFALSLQPGGIDLVRGYPLLLLALAVALLLAGLVARPIQRQVFAPALLLALAGGVGLAFTAGYAPSNLLASAAPFAPVVLALLALVWIAPAIVRRRK
ncbi:MAG: hypothetical protein SGI73_13360 [Chloroflexota bacterium]|nr:hypothetical protein [Chloroflexota bacterium]